MKHSFFAASQMKSALMLLMLALCIGCGGGSTSSTPTSQWAGTYTGDLNFSGCPSQNPCGGDSITVTVTQAYVNPEFSPTLTLTGTDSTTAFTGTGDTADVSPAASGPGGPGGATATFTTSLSENSFSVGARSGSSQNSSPLLMQTFLVYNCAGPVNAETGTCGGNGAYLGTLTRQ
jgi:hypothetical protein